MINAFAVMEPKGTLQQYQYDPGTIGASEVEIHVEYCGICHSDVAMIDNDWGRSSYPLVPGHEVIGTVGTIGSEVTTLQVGDVVGLGWQSDYCMTCSTCMSGDHNLCLSAQPTIVGRHGGFADKVRASAASVVKLPAGIDKAIAGPLFCAGITVFNPLIQFDIQPTDKVAVIGIGGLGHLALKFLKSWGCEVTAFTSSAGKQREALYMGASHTIDSTDTEVIKRHADEFDLIISTVDVKLDWAVYLSTLKPKGRLHFVGVPLQPLDIGVVSLLRGQKSVSASPVGSPASIEKMLDFAALHGIEPAVEEYNIAQINDALERLRSGAARYRVVINMSANRSSTQS
ncbi:Aldehyde reductase Ahr [Halioglobus japonicus]|nr:Aldehyde reductase Ahr [Halioglobus japonicus]